MEKIWEEKCLEQWIPKLDAHYNVQSVQIQPNVQDAFEVSSMREEIRDVEEVAQTTIVRSRFARPAKGIISTMWAIITNIILTRCMDDIQKLCAVLGYPNAMPQDVDGFVNQIRVWEVKWGTNGDYLSLSNFYMVSKISVF